MSKIIISFLLTFSLIVLLQSLSVSAKINNCPVNLANLKIEENCLISIGELHPTQAKVGMYQVYYNQELLKFIEDHKSPKYKSINEYLKDQVIPVIIGANNKMYLIDNHHTVRAIWDYYKADKNTKVYIKVIKNWANKKDFWEEMKANNYTYLGASGAEIKPSQLPENIGGLTNDNYRSAVGLAVKWAFFEKPKGDAKYFYQFKWGNCLKQLNFKLPEKINREDVYATAAFLYNQENKGKMKRICNVSITDGESFSDMIKVLEN